MSVTEEGLSVMQNVLSGGGESALAAGAGQQTAAGQQDEGTQDDGVQADQDTGAQGEQAAQAGTGAAKTYTQEEVDALVRQASERAADAVFARLSSRQTTPGEAAELWNYLGENPELAAKVQELIDSHTPAAQNPVDLVRQVEQRFEQRIALREAKADLAEKDPVYRENREQIEKWSEKQGIPIQTARDLHLAVMAFKGSPEFQAVLAQKAQQRRGQDAAAARGAQKVLGSGGGKPPAPDYQKMSDAEFLKHKGLSLYTDKE